MRIVTRTPLAAALFCFAGLAAGCPTTPEPPVDTFVAPDADVEVAQDDTDTSDTLLPECDARADCLPPGPLPACQDVACEGGRCVLLDLADETACDDGNPCTGPGTCEAGVCVGRGDACDDDNPCTTDGCDPAGECVHTFNQRPCDDTDPCTTGDHCQSGACAGEAVDCDDHNACTTDACLAETGCTHTARGGACDDEDACTTGDMCVAGVCTPGTPKVCGDPENPCISASCDPDEGCVVETLSGPCNDGNACTTDDACVAGVCAGQTLGCDDENPCTDDYCDPAAGCVTTDNVAPCDDGDVCTLDDRCSDGACVGGGANPQCCAPGDDAACDDGDACTTDLCDGGLCANVPLSCDDGAACTADRCVLGACEHAFWGPGDGGSRVAADFEGADALAGWTLDSTNADVAWRLDASQTHGGGGALYCGAIPDYSYDKGTTLAVATHELAIPPGQATLSFWVHLDVEENTSCVYDVLRVSLDGVELAPVCATTAGFAEQVHDVSAFAGRVVTLSLTFDTLDDQANAGSGAWVDDLSVRAVNALDCCDANPDCDDGDACTTDTCGVDGACEHVAAPICP